MTEKRFYESLLLKALGWFFVVRVHHILLLVCAQYFAAARIFSDGGFSSLLYDYNFMFLVLATVCSVSAGYMINYPIRSRVVGFADFRAKKRLLLSLIFLGILAAYLVSWRAALFFALYMSGSWLYNFLLKHLVLVGNVLYALLSVIPFFVLLLYFRTFDAAVFAYGFFLFTLLFLNSCLKDVANVKGDYLNHHHTIASVYGEVAMRKVVVTVMFLLFVLSLAIPYFFDARLMRFYFYFCAGLFFTTWIAFTILKDRKKDYQILRYLLKLIVVFGVFSILLYNK